MKNFNLQLDVGAFTAALFRSCFFLSYDKYSFLFVQEFFLHHHNN